jgi:hypothetical protein
MWSRKVWIGVAVVVAVAAAGAAPARAVDPSVYPEPAWPVPTERMPALPTFPVLIRGDEPGVSVRLVTGTGEGIPCGARCTLELPHGRYRVVATAPNGSLSTQYLHVSRPSDVTVTPQNKAARNTGFTFMGLGVAGIGAGAGMTAVWLWWRMVLGFSCGEGGSPCDDSDYPPKWLLPAGLVSLGAGLALGATGLILWRKNAHAEVIVRPLGSSGLALTGSF